MGTFKDVEREEMEHFEEHLATVDAGKKKETTDITMDVEPTDAPIEELTDRNAEWRKELRASMKQRNAPLSSASRCQSWTQYIVQLPAPRK